MMSKKSLTIIIAVIVLGIGGFYAYTSFFNNSSESKEEADTALSQKETLANTSTDPTTTDSTSTNAAKPSTNTSDSYTTPSSSDSITISASQPTSSEVVVSTKLSGYSDGTCNLTIKNGSSTINKSAQVFYQPEFSTCAGFTIEKAELGSGTWAITLSVVSSGETVSQSTTLEVQ